MTIVVPFSTQFVPDGTNLPQNYVWRGTISGSTLLTASFASAQQAPGFPGVDFDLNIENNTTGALIFQRNSFWTETNVTFTETLQPTTAVRFGLEGGGEPKGTHQGTVFGFQLDVSEVAVTFGASDRQLLVGIERKLDRSPYQLVLIHTGVSSNRQINLQPGVSAVGWLFRQIPTNTNSTSGLPPYYFHLGFVTPLSDQGYLRSRRITFQNQLFELPPATRSIALTITPGLVIDLTEYTVPLSS